MKSKGYLYKTFGLTSVNTAKDLKRKANPYVSASVLLGGLAIALILHLTYSYSEKANDIVYGVHYDKYSIEAYD